MLPEEREFINRYLFIDGQYFLTRNWAFLKTRGLLDVRTLLEMFLKSIGKIQSKVMADNVILLFDSYPYRKTKELIDAGVDYKGNREFALDRINEINKILETETNPSEIEALNKELEEKKKDHASFLIRKETKVILKEWLPKFGISTLSIPTLEADDLACQAALWSKKHINRENRERSVICSSDSDWLSFCSPWTDMYRTTKTEEWLKFEDSFGKIPKRYRLSLNLYEYNLLHNAYYGDHNNIKKDPETVEKYTFTQVVNNYLNGDISKMPYVEKVFNALNVIEYYNDDIEKAFDDACLSIKPDFSMFIEFCTHFDLRISEYIYDEILNFSEIANKNK